jgi:O-antigen/teichoic acid export membrane protein
VYAILHVTVALLIRIIYATYCHRHFDECHYKRSNERGLMKEMMSFAGFSFLNNAANILNSQGLNILINIFFGVVLNAARGVATQVEGAILQLVNNFTVAVNPQITKSYAAGDKKRMFRLVCLGSKFAYFMLLFIAIPVFLETECILNLWLKTVPEYTVVFLRLSIVGGMVKMLGNTGYTACMATGDIKSYSIWITSVGILAFPLTWLVFFLGFSAEYAYYVFIVVYVMVEVVRLVLMKKMLGFPPIMFVKDVLLSIIIVTPISLLLPLLCSKLMDPGIIRLIVITMVSVVSTAGTVYCLGLNKKERQYFLKNALARLHRK